MRKKILGVLIISVCMMFTLAVLNVSAAVARTATISLSAETGKAGDTITANVNLSNTVNTCQISYKLKYDPNVFEIDATQNVDYEQPNCIDTNFLDYYAGLTVGKKWGLLTMGTNVTAGTIAVTGARATGITATNNINNIQIGGFILKVKDGASAGDSQITLILATTMDAGEGSTVGMIYSPVTFKVESGVDLVTAPVVTGLGAQIRTTGIQGLRFGTKLTKNDFFKGIGLTGSDKNGAVVTDITYGTLILPTAYLGGAELTIDGVYGKTVANVLGTNIYEETPAYIVFTAVLTGIPAAQYDTSFTARAYVKYKLDGVDQIVYFEPIARTVNGVTAASMQ